MENQIPISKASKKINYKLIEGITSADYAYDITGKNLPELFENAALALTSAMVKLETVKPKTRKNINLSAATVDKLLYDFLDEVLFIKDTANFLSAKVKIEVKNPGLKDKTYKLNAILFGEEIDQSKHKLGNDVKAITYHNFSVKEEEIKEKNSKKVKKSWVARVVLDV
ncbi:archease [Candidatus Woesearchaeota archaeon]|nr:archease [Candidatus Woesearchaeota archaeon]